MIYILTIIVLILFLVIIKMSQRSIIISQKIPYQEVYNYLSLRTNYIKLLNFNNRLNIMQHKIYDAIIVGAGHNGLVAANYLSKANKKVLVLERRPIVGGAALTEELIPGFRFSRCSYVLSLFRKQIIKDLNLFDKGLKIFYRDISSLTPTKQVDKYLLFHQDSNKTKKQISKFSKKDAENWDNYQAYLKKICKFWDSNVDSIPYNFKKNPGFADMYNFLNKIYQPRMDYFNLGRFFTSSVEQMLDTWFQSQILKATLATDGIIGENLSVSNTTTAYVLLHHVMGELEEGRQGQWGYVEGGNGKISEILASTAKEQGTEIKVNSEVQQIVYKNGKPSGVLLKSGQFIQSKIVLSNCTNRVTFEHLVQNSRSILGDQLYFKIKHTEYNGAVTKLNIALKKLPKFKSFRNHQLPAQKLLQGTIHINCQSMDQLKKCFNETKTNRISKNPFMDITIPSIFDKSLCPEGYHIMNCFLQYTPYRPNNGEQPSPISHESIKQAFLNSINQYLEQPLDIHFMDILTPFDLQNLLNLTQGNIFHGSIGLENIFVNRLSGNVGGVWLCGSSAHPGGGVMGAVGQQVSAEILNTKII